MEVAAVEVTDEMVEAGSRAAYGDHFERYRGLIRRALDAALAKAARERATPAPVRAEGEATHRHKKRGTDYVLIGFGTYVCFDHSVDYDDVYVREVAPGVWHVVDLIRSKSGDKWARMQCAGKVENGCVVAIYRSVDDGREIWVRALKAETSR